MPNFPFIRSIGYRGKARIAAVWFTIITLPRDRYKLWIAIKASAVALCSVPLGFVAIDFNGSNPFRHDEFKRYIATNNLVLALVLLLPVISTTIFDLLERLFEYRRQTDTPENDEYLTIISALDQIVGKKLTRFGECAARMRGRADSKANVFEAITQPRDQIQEIVLHLYFAVRAILKDDSLEVILVVIEEGIPSNYIVHLPNDHVPPANLLAGRPRETLFFFCARENKAMAIPDIQLHLQTKAGAKRNYCPSEAGADDKGSIAAFPIFHQHLNKVVYVLTMKSQIPNVITRNNLKKLSKIVDMFGKRIILEHSLIVIKGNAT